MIKKINTSLVLKSGVASIDQALLSFVSFLIAILLIKTVSKVEYGYYSIALPVVLFLVAVQNAIVNTPLTILLAAKKQKDKEQYVAALYHGQLKVIFPLALSGGIVFALLWFFEFGSIQTNIVTAVCLAAAGFLYREFLRSYFFAEESPLQVLKLDILYIVIFFGLISLDYWFFKISVAGVFFLMGISALFVSQLFKQQMVWRTQPRTVRESYRENWIYGRWSLLGVIVTHIQTYSYVYLLGLFLGSEAVADVSAARMLMMPLFLFESGWGKIVRPHGSRLREENKILLFFRQQILMCLIFVIGAFLYVLFLMLSSDVFEKFLLSSKYANSFNYIYYWGLVFLLGFVESNASFGLQVMKNFRVISLVNLITMLITVAYAYFLIQSKGIQGALIALIIGKGISVFVLWFCFTKNSFFTVKRGVESNLKVIGVDQQ